MYVGFQPDTQIFQLVSPNDYRRSQKMELAYEIQSRLSSRPGIGEVGFVNVPPLVSGTLLLNFYVPAGQESQNDTLTDDDKTFIRGISLGYLKAIGRQDNSLKVSARVFIAALSLFAPPSPPRTP